MYTQSILHLEYLLLKYQIERLRIERGRRTSQGLFDTAKEMLETLSHLRTGKAELKGHWFDWLVSSLLLYLAICSTACQSDGN